MGQIQEIIKDEVKIKLGYRYRRYRKLPDLWYGTYCRETSIIHCDRGRIDLGKIFQTCYA